MIKRLARILVAAFIVIAALPLPVSAASPKMAMVYYGIHDAGIDAQIVAAAPDILIGNTAGGLWAGDLVPATFQAVGIDVYSYITASYGATPAATNEAFIDAIALEGSDGVFIDQSSSSATAYMTSLCAYAQLAGLSVIINPGTSIINADLYTIADYVMTDEQYQGRNPTAIESAHLAQTIVIGYGVTSAAQAATWSQAAITKGFAYTYHTQAEYTSLPSWFDDYIVFYSSSAPASSFASPDTLVISSTNAYQNCLETGDQLYIVTGTINYVTNPSLSAYDLFLVRLMNGATELQSVEPYAFYDEGYDYFVTGLYFSAEDVTTLGMGWGAGTGYSMRIEGNPAQNWADSPVPSYTLAGIADWQSGATVAATQLQLTLKIRTLAVATETTWGIALTDFLSGVRKFNATGEDYFTTSIPNLRTMCPLLFGLAEYTPDFPDKGLVNIGYTGGDDTNQLIYGVNWGSQTFTTGTTFDIAGVYFKHLRLGTPGTLTVSLRATAAGLPNGADLVTGTLNGNTSATSAAWDSVVFTSSYSLAANTTYAFVWRATTGDVNNNIGIRMDSAGLYTGGQVSTSTDSGATWNAQAAKDFMFTVMAEDANNLTWLQQWEGRLIGTPFDFTDLANSLNWERMLLGTMIWLAISIGIAFYITRQANSFKAGLPSFALVMAVGGPLGMSYAAISISIPILILLGALYAVLKPAN